MSDCAVKIAVRERPLRGCLKDAASVADCSIVQYYDKNTIVLDERIFNFDHVLGPAISQRQLYDDLIKPLVAKLKQGFNCTALAYGQTGTGKSYTMGLNLTSFEGEHVGVIPRCLREILEPDQSVTESVKPKIKREISASFIEIYNEKVHDLLADNSKEPIIARGYKFTGGTRKSLSNIQECYSILTQGTKNRHVRPTKLNTQSSRSHAIFTIHMCTRNGDHMTTSCMNLVDLAGSEGVRRTGHQGMAMSEGVNINQGLLSIGKVLQAMCAGSKVIPYRDSVLSSVLQDSLNSNSYMTLLACISPRREDLSETLSTLRFAKNAKQLKNTPHVNIVISELKKIKAKSPNKAAPSKKVALKSVIRGNVYNSFCTPSKTRRIDQSRLNRTSVGGKTSQQKQKAQTDTFMRRTQRETLFEKTNNRESLFNNHSYIDSMMPLNASTSTVVDEPTNKSERYSPVVRQCLADMETHIDAHIENKILQFQSKIEREIQNKMIASLRTVHKENVKSIDINQLAEPSSNTLCSSVQCSPEQSKQGVQLFPNTIREELMNIMKEMLEKQQMKSKTNISPVTLTPQNQNIKCQLFATNSPVFKVPDVPKINNEQDDVNVRIDELPVQNPKMVPETETTFSFPQAAVKNKTKRYSAHLSKRSMDSTFSYETSMVIPEEEPVFALPEGIEIKNTKRRSVRVAERTNRVSLQNDTSFETVRRRSTRKSTIQNHREKRCSTRLSVPSDAAPTTKRPIKSPKKANSICNNSVITGYLKGSNIKELSNSKDTNRVRHRKAVLDLLNKGSMKELQVLPHIGQKTAYQIVTQRALNGKFKNFAQIEKLPIWRGSSWQRFAQANILL